MSFLSDRSISGGGGEESVDEAMREVESLDRQQKGGCRART